MVQLDWRTPVIALVLLGVVLVAPSSAGAKRFCHQSMVESTVGSFIRSFNAGDAAAAVRRWAPEPAFEWYSTDRPGERFNADARDRATLAAYFEARIARHERLRRTVFRVALDPRRRLGHFHGVLRRSADDLRARIYSYKGAVDCSSGRPLLIVWSMAWRDRTRR
jgi:hypothetical protein